MEHRIQWENYMTHDEYDALAIGSTIHLKDSGSYQKVKGWGAHHETLLLNCQTFVLHAPESLIIFKDAI